MKKSITVRLMAMLCTAVMLLGLVACNDTPSGNGGNDSGGGTTTTEHTLTEHKAKDATCTEGGNLAYWECTDCGKLFSDKDGESETTLAAVTVAAKGHTLTKTDGKPATCKDEGILEYWTCGVCEKLFSDGEGKTEITQADTVIPVTDKHTYGDMQSDGSGHWKECKVCGKTAEKAAHDFGEGLTCTACGYTYDPAKDTAPATLDELFPDDTAATAVELAKAEYYQGAAKESLKIIYDYIKSNHITKHAETINYKFYFNDTIVNKIETLQFSIYYHNKETDTRAFMVFDVSFPTPLNVSDLYNADTIAAIKFTDDNIDRPYSYIINQPQQGDKDEFIKAVADKLAPDFDYTAPDTQLLYTYNGDTVVGGYGEARDFTVVIINHYGVREFNIITRMLEDSELIEHIQKDDFKQGPQTSVDFGKYQLSVDLTATTVAPAIAAR